MKVNSEKQLCYVGGGHCSTDQSNIEEAWEMASILQLSILRLVGAKSRTRLTPKGMGWDVPVLRRNLKLFMQGKIDQMEIPLSARLAKKVYNKTGVIIASEIMSPLQLYLYSQVFPNGGFMPWNPAVDQLGPKLYELAQFAETFNWYLGIKNGKCLGRVLREVETDNPKRESALEKTWTGLASYAEPIKDKVFLIHRGVDVPENGNYRNHPVHKVAARVKIATKGCKMLFDPSHVHGPNLRDEIVPATVAAMKMKLTDGSYMYDGFLVESGASVTDTRQHITVKELIGLIERVGEFRELAQRPAVFN